MSRKFRWFLLAACAFVVVMNCRETLLLLADGPQAASPSSELKGSQQLVVDRKRPPQPMPQKRMSGDAELARGIASK